MEIITKIHPNIPNKLLNMVRRGVITTAANILGITKNLTG